MTVSIYHSRTGKLIFSTDTYSEKYTFGCLVDDVARKLNVYRSSIGIKTEKRGRLLRLSNSAVIQDIQGYSETDGLKLYFSDLGIQVGFRVSYILEYLAALIPYALFYILFEKRTLKTNYNVNNIRLAALCWFSHFFKRIYESIYVHKFSRDTMPLYSCIRNIVHYGGFSIAVGYSMHNFQSLIYRPLLEDSIFTFLFFFFAFCNWQCHVYLSNLRKGDNDNCRPCPKPNGCNATLMYNFVSFPNYFYEIMTWTMFTFLTKSFASASFTIVGGAIMSKWALAKHRGYIKDPAYPKNRRAIIPMIL